MPDQEYVEREPVRLAYRVVEAGSSAPREATPMVLLHGGGGDSTTYDRLAPAFAARRRVYLPDLRGMGRSDRVGPYSLRIMRDDISRFLDDRGLDRAILLGHSLGAFVAMLVTQAAPDRVSALVLEECPPPVPLNLPVPTSVPETAPYYDRAIRPFMLAELNAPDPLWWEALAEVTVPTLVLSGGPTSFLPQETVARFAARLPAGQLVTLPAGHHIHAEAPAAFTDAVETFLA